VANNAPTSFGTAFATAGFSFDPNLSPNNQTFSSAVVAIINRLGIAFPSGTGGGGGSVTSVAGTSIGPGSAAVTITGSPITTSGTLTLSISTFAGTNPGVVPSSAGGTLNFLRADGAYAVPPGGGTGSLISVSGTATGAGTAAVQISNVPLTNSGGTFTLTINTFAGTNPGVVPSSAGGTLNFLRADGAYAAPPGNGLGTLSGPTNQVALTSTAGTSTAGMRSDSTPALSVAIVPTWTGQHTFNGPNPGGAQAVLGTSTSYAWGTGTNYPILQFAGLGAIAGTATGGLLVIGGGLYYNGTSYVYGQAGTAAVISLQNGTALIQLSTAGTAGQTAAPSNQLVVTAGGVQVPGTATIATLVVTGTATVGNLLATTETVGTLAFTLLTGAGTATFGAGTFAGPLTASGTSTLNNITVSGTATLNALQVTGTATIATLNVTGTATIGNLLATTETLGALNVTGTATISTLNVTGTATIGNLLATTETFGAPLVVKSGAVQVLLVSTAAAVTVLGTSTNYAWGTGTNYPITQFAGIGGVMGTATIGLVLMGGGLYWNGTNYIYGQAGTGAIAALGTGTFSVSAVNTSGTAGGTATPFVVMSVSGSATLGGVVLGTGTLLPWGGGAANSTVVQLGITGGFYAGAGASFLMNGVSYNGTNYLFTGTGGGGTSTAVNIKLQGVNFIVQSGGVGTYTQAATLINVFQVGGTIAPTAQAYGPTAAGLVDMTPDQGTFTATLGAVTTAINPVCFWARQGNHVMLAVGTGTGTSNANTFTLAGLPAAITPTRIQRVEVPDFAIENSGAVGSITTDAEMIVPTNGTMTFLNGGTATGWGATLFKGISSVFTVSYLLN
jgi:hypothetical protein